MPQLLNFCVDSLDVRILSLSSLASHVPATAQKFRSYIEGFDHATSEDYFIEIPGVGLFRLLHHSTRPYEFTLVNPEIADIRIWNPDKSPVAISTQTGQLYVNFRSRFLQEFTLEAVEPVLHALKSWYFEDPSAPGFTRVSRADLAADISFRNLEWADLDNFVTRARKFDTFAVDSLQSQLNQAISLLQAPPLDNKGASTCIDSVASAIALIENVQNSLQSRLSDAEPTRVVSSCHPETIYFGRFGGDLYARIYDKSASLGAQGKEYMRDIWATAGWDGQTTVLRVEFSLSGDFLKNTELLGQCDHRSLPWFTKVIPSLWTYLTKDWLRHCVPTNDQTRSRWAISEFWEAVQEANDPSLQIVRSKAPRSTLQQPLMAGLQGYFSALVSNVTLQTEQIYDIAVEHLFKLSQWIESNAFLDKIQEKRKKKGNDDISIQNRIEFYNDTELSAHIRREVMARGKGS